MKTIFTIANFITSLRILCIPYFVYFILNDNQLYALYTFIFGAFTDLFDGLLARKLSQISNFGKCFDPIADKLLILTTYFMLSFFVKIIPIYVFFIIIARDIMILTGCYFIFKKKCSYNIRPSFIGKITTFLQMFTVMCLLIDQRFSNAVIAITVAFTVISGIDYFILGKRMIFGKKLLKGD